MNKEEYQVELDGENGEGSFGMNIEESSWGITCQNDYLENFVFFGDLLGSMWGPLRHFWDPSKTETDQWASNPLLGKCPSLNFRIWA